MATLRQVLSAFQSAGEWKKAVALLKKMTLRGITPNEVSYSATILAVSAGKDAH
jgi:pentatricopeptide repeat protein